MLFFGHQYLKAHNKLDDKHVCLMSKKEEIMVRYIDGGYLVPFRRKFRNFLMVCETNPLSKKYLKSTAAIRLEKIRHLHYFYYMIHPFSNGRIYWEMFMMIILTLLFIIIPISVCVNDTYTLACKTTLDVLNIIDIVLTFCTGYLKGNTHKIAMDIRKVAKNYIFGLFIFDVLTSFNVFIIVLQPFLFANDDKKLFIGLKMINYLKILRAFTLLRYLERFRQWKQYNMYTFKVLYLVLCYMFTIWWYGCILYTMHYFSDHNSSVYTDVGLNYKLLLQCLYNAIYMIFLLGQGERVSDKQSILFFHMVILLTGYLLYIYTISQIIHIVNKYNTTSNKYSQIIEQLHEFIRMRNIPAVISKRILTYFEFRYKRNYFSENDILGTLSKNLRQEIFVYHCKKHLDNVQIFKDIPQSLLYRLVSCMKTKIYLANDLIIQAGNYDTSIYFIHSGTVAVYTPQGKEICHLTEGANFGEVALMLVNEKRAASVIAIDSVELYSLSNQDFLKCIEPFPDYYTNMMALAEERMKIILMLDASEDGDESTINSVLLRGLIAGSGEFKMVNDGSRTRMHYHM